MISSMLEFPGSKKMANSELHRFRLDPIFDDGPSKTAAANGDEQTFNRITNSVKSAHCQNRL